MITYFGVALTSIPLLMIGFVICSNFKKLSLQMLSSLKTRVTLYISNVLGISGADSTSLGSFKNSSFDRYRHLIPVTTLSANVSNDLI